MCTSAVLGGIGFGNLELVVDLCLEESFSLFKHLECVPELDN